MDESTFELLKAIIPSAITAVVAIIALITSAYSSHKALNLKCISKSQVRMRMQRNLSEIFSSAMKTALLKQNSCPTAFTLSSRQKAGTEKK